MKRKPIKIDWDELEAAFNNSNEELDYYLDLVTGQVFLEGEGEGDSFEDEDQIVDDAAMDLGGRDDSTRLHIESPGAEEELAWMSDFIQESDGLGSELTGQLEEALSSQDAVRAFREFLRHQAEVRDRWFVYRSDRLHEAMEAWLDANEVRSVAPPPWRG